MPICSSHPYFPVLYYRGIATEEKLKQLYDAAAYRDRNLTRDEWWAKVEAVRECELGPQWWKRGHP